MNVIQILGIILIFAGIIIPVGVILETDFDKNDKIVDCFDKYNNKIQGINCVDEYNPSEVYGTIIFVYILSVICICIGVWAVGGED